MVNTRDEIAVELEESPSLRQELTTQLVARTWRRARRLAALDTVSGTRLPGEPARGTWTLRC